MDDRLLQIGQLNAATEGGGASAGYGVDEIIARRAALVDELDDAVRAAAAAMPKQVQVAADMGSTGVLQIVLAEQPGSFDPPDCAGIDPEDDPAAPRWWVDVGGGEQTAISKLGPTAPPEVVADWISQAYETLRSRQRRDPAPPR